MPRPLEYGGGKGREVEESGMITEHKALQKFLQASNVGVGEGFMLTVGGLIGG